jgi:hypothetical protein
MSAPRFSELQRNFPEEIRNNYNATIFKDFYGGYGPGDLEWVTENEIQLANRDTM